MKLSSLLTIVIFFFSMNILSAQDELPSTGSFGEEINKKGSVSAKKLPKKMEGAESLNIKVKGTTEHLMRKKY